MYGVYWLLKALYHLDVDHGQLALDILTRCDTNSYCHMLQNGATCVMAAWSREGKPNLSWSHPWASAPASAVAWGFFGIRPTAPGFKTFECRPQPGNVSSAATTVPTLSGFIRASFRQWFSQQEKDGGSIVGIRLELHVPANTMAKVCLPRFGLASTSLSIDGVAIGGFVQRDYVCVDGVGSGVAARVISRGVTSV